MKPEIIYKDHEIWIINKSAGLSAQTDSTGNNSVTRYLGKDYVITRLDKRVSGLMLVTKTEGAAAKFSEIVRFGALNKIYHCGVSQKPADPKGTLTHWLKKEKGKTHVYKTEIKQAQKSVLNYTLIISSERTSTNSSRGATSLLHIHNINKKLRRSDTFIALIKNKNSSGGATS